VTGVIDFASNGERQNVQVAILQVQGGKIVPYTGS